MTGRELVAAALYNAAPAILGGVLTLVGIFILARRLADRLSR